MGTILINGSIHYEIPDSKMKEVEAAIRLVDNRPSVYTGHACHVESNTIGERRKCCKVIEAGIINDNCEITIRRTPQKQHTGREVNENELKPS